METTLSERRKALARFQAPDFWKPVQTKMALSRLVVVFLVMKMVVLLMVVVILMVVMMVVMVMVIMVMMSDDHNEGINAFTSIELQSLQSIFVSF